MDENVVLYIEDASDLPTLIKAGRHMKDLVSCMRHYFATSGSFLCANSDIMIAFYPKSKETSSLNHFIVCLFIVSISLHILDILPQVTTAKSKDKVKDIGSNEEANASANRDELFVSSPSYYKAHQ